MQEELYASFASERMQVMEELVKEQHKEDMKELITTKKKDLIAEEQELTMFYNEKKIDLVLEQRHQYK